MRVTFHSGGHPIVRFDPSVRKHGLEFVTYAEGMHSYPGVQVYKGIEVAPTAWLGAERDGNQYLIEMGLFDRPFAVTPEHTIWRLSVTPLVAYYQGYPSIMGMTVTLRRLHVDNSWHLEVHDYRTSVEVPLEHFAPEGVLVTYPTTPRYEREDVL